MSATYNLDDLIAKMPGEIESIEEVINSIIPNTCARLEELGKEVGAQQVIDDMAAIITSLGGLSDALKQILGEEGDSIQTATMYGELACAKKMNAALNNV